MVTLKLRYRYVHEDVDRHGNVRLYFRRRKGEPKIRILERPGTEEFSRRYHELLEAAEAGQLRSSKTDKAETITHGSFRWLCTEYFRSMEASGELDKRTLHVRRLVLEKVWDEPLKPGSKDLVGDCPAHLVSAKLVAVVRDRRKDAPETANARVKAIRRVYAWAMEPKNEIPGLNIRMNPARDVPFLRPKNQGGFHTWTEAEVEQFRERHPLGTKARLALDLLLYTGVRRSDVVRLGRQHLRNGWWKFTTYKGRNRRQTLVEIPCLPVLQETINATPCTGDLTFIVNAYGRPFTAEGFGNWFRDRCNEAGLKHCSAHGLRKAGATLAAENGATTNQLMSIFGWLTAKEAERYTKAAERKRLAANATTLLMRSGGDR